MATEWDIGDLSVRDGRLALCDPLLFLAPDWAVWLDVPSGDHVVEIHAIDDPHGDERIDQAAIFFADEEPVTWDPVGEVPIDSGILAFATSEAVGRLLDESGTLADELLEAMAGNHTPTWESGGADGIVGCTGGLGDGYAQAYLGRDADGALVCLSVAFLADGEIEQSPGRGLQRAFLMPARFGAVDDPRNVVPVPMHMNRVMTSVERVAGHALLSGHEVELEVIPQYEGDSPVPVEMKSTVSTNPV